MDNIWYDLTEFVIESSQKSITVDTRDFHCIGCSFPMNKVNGSGSYYDKFNDLIDLIENNTIPSESIIPKSLIIPFIEKLKRIKEESNVIMLRFDGVTGGDYWIKYLRFYRIGNTDMFIATNNCTPLYWGDIELEKLVSKY